MNSFFKYIFLFMLFLFPQISRAKSDSTYVKVFRNELIFSAYSGYSLAALEYLDDDHNDIQSYKPNTSASIGFGIGWNWFAASIKAYGFRPDEKYGKTKSFDFQSHWFLSKVQLSLSLQNYKGFYTEDEQNNNAIITRPDLAIKLYRLYGQYIFNNKKFSYRSGFMYDEQQLRSSGSFLAGVGFYYTSIESDSTLFLGGIVKYHQVVEDYQIAPSFGYTHNFVFGKKKKWFTNLSMTLGLGISVKNDDNKVKAFPIFYPRIAFGYAGKNWMVGVSAHFLQSQISKMEDAGTSLSSGLFQITGSYRIPFDLKRVLR